MFLTQHYAVLCIFGVYFAAGGLKMIWTRNTLDAMYLDPLKKNKWLVIDRIHGQGLCGNLRVGAVLRIPLRQCMGREIWPGSQRH